MRNRLKAYNTYRHLRSRSLAREFGVGGGVGRQAVLPCHQLMRSDRPRPLGTVGWNPGTIVHSVEGTGHPPVRSAAVQRVGEQSWRAGQGPDLEFGEDPRARCDRPPRPAPTQAVHPRTLYMSLPLRNNPMHMDIAAMKLELVQRMLAVRDTAILDRLREVIDMEVEDRDITDEEVAELELLRAERLSGEGGSYSWEEVQRMAREMVKQ